MSSNNNLAAFLITLGAGLATAIGGAAVRFGSLQSPQFLSLSMALAAGVMLHVSYVEILWKSYEAFVEAWPETETDQSGPRLASVATYAMLFLGVFGIFLLGKAVDRFQEMALAKSHADHHNLSDKPGAISEDGKNARHRSSMIAPETLASYIENQKEILEYGEDAESGREISLSAEEKATLLRTSIVTALAIAAHNLPEGLATFIALSSNLGNGIPLAVAIMIHNIPEGICVAVPILYATGSRVKAFLVALAAGLAEPIGAAFGWIIIESVNPASFNLLYGCLFGLVAGLMIYIALVELIPTAVTYYPSHPGRVAFALFTGIFIMSLSLVIFEFS